MEAKHKNVLIGALLAVVFVMAVGYAAFAQTLTINGSAEITSTWDVQMTSIETTGHTGTGSDVPYASGTAEDGTRLVNGSTATFKANLLSPSDSVTYTVTIHNGGTINAEVDSISFLQGPNTGAMTYTYTGINEGDVLNAGEDKTFTVTVTYNSTVTTQPDPEDLSNSLTMTIDYVQEGM